MPRNETCYCAVVAAIVVMGFVVSSTDGIPNVRYVTITAKPGSALVLNEVQVYSCGTSTNVALNKTAVGTSLGISCSLISSDRRPSLAVDGLSSCNAGFSNTFCSSPPDFSVASWRVDLGQEYDVCTVSLIQTKEGAATLMLDDLTFYGNVSTGSVALATTTLLTNQYAMIVTCGGTSCTVAPVSCTACSAVSTCSNRSENVGNVSGSYPACSCSCLPRYYGAYCENASPCTIAEDCSNNALSVSGTYPSCTCACKAPWSGASCTSRLCVLGTDCNAAGTSSVSGTYPSCVCTCVHGYAGPTCAHTSSESISPEHRSSSETVSRDSSTRVRSASVSSTANRASVSVSTTPGAASGTASSSRATYAATTSRSVNTSHSVALTFSGRTETVSLPRPTVTVESITSSESLTPSAPTKQPSHSRSADVGTLSAHASVSSNCTTATMSSTLMPYCQVPFSSMERYLHSGNVSSSSSQAWLAKAVALCEAQQSVLGRQCVGVAMNEHHEMFVPSVMWYTSPPPVIVVVVVLPELSKNPWSLGNVSTASVNVTVTISESNQSSNSSVVLWFAATDPTATWRSISLLPPGNDGGGVVLLPLRATCLMNATMSWVTLIPIFPSVPTSQSIAATTTVLIGASSGGDLTSAAATLLLSTLSCTTTAGGAGSSGGGGVASYLISPFFGQGPAAMAWGNAAVVVCVTVLHLAVVWSVMCLRRVSFVDVAGGKLRFPALSLQIADCWMPGVALGATAALLQTHRQENTIRSIPSSSSLSSNQALLFVLLAVALLYPLVCTVATLHWIVPQCRWESYDLRALPTRSSWDAYWYPSGRWGPKPLRNSFGPLMGAMQWKWVALGSAFRTLNVLLGVVNGLQNTSWCGGGVVALGVVHVLAAAGLCLARPLRLPMSAICHPVTHVLAAAVCALTYAQSSALRARDSVTQALVAMQILYAVVGVWRLLWVSWMSYREASWDSYALEKHSSEESEKPCGGLGDELRTTTSMSTAVEEDLDGKINDAGGAQPSRRGQETAPAGRVRCCRTIETLLHALWFGGGGRGEEIPNDFVEVQSCGSRCPQRRSATIGTLDALFPGDSAEMDEQGGLATATCQQQLNPEAEDTLPPLTSCTANGAAQVTLTTTANTTTVPRDRAELVDDDVALAPSLSSPVGRSPTSNRALFGIENYFLVAPSPKPPQEDLL